METNSRKIGLFYLMIVGFAFLAFVVTYYQKNRTLSMEELAEERAQLVGQSLIDKKFQQRMFLSSPASTNRGLASADEAPSVLRTNLAGEMGRDPWGRPFYFQVKGDGIKNSTLYIWSLGEDAKPNFKDTKDLMLQGTRGDDVVVTIEF